MKKISNVLLFILIAIGAGKYIEKVIDNSYKNKHTVVKTTKDVARIEAERDRLAKEEEMRFAMPLNLGDTAITAETSEFQIDSILLSTPDSIETDLPTSVLQGNVPTDTVMNAVIVTPNAESVDIATVASSAVKNEIKQPKEITKNNHPTTLYQLNEVEEPRVQCDDVMKEPPLDTLETDLPVYQLSKDELKDHSIVLTKRVTKFDKSILTDLKKQLIANVKEKQLATKQEEIVSPKSHQFEVDLLGKGNNATVNIQINGLAYVATLNFSAPMVQISESERNQIRETNSATLHLNGAMLYQLPDGTNLKVEVIKLEVIKLGEKVLRNVDAVVIPDQDVNIILGQSAFARLNNLVIDQEKGLLKFN